MTVTKTCLDVLKQLGNAFSNAMAAGGKSGKSKMAPFVLKNETGLSMTLHLENGYFKVQYHEFNLINSFLSNILSKLKKKTFKKKLFFCR